MARISPVTGHYITIDVDGYEYKVFYNENGKGQPLVCQHTAGCHNHQWRGLLEDEEITKNYRVIAYDLPRHGKSDPPHNKPWWNEEYRLTADHYVNFVMALCDGLELEDPIFMGCSFGGQVTLQLALRHPERFKALIAVEASAHSPGFFLDWWRHPKANAAQVCASGVWDLMAPMSPDMDRWLTWHYYTQGSEAFKGDLYFYSVDHDLREDIDKIDASNTPLVLLTGDYDYLTTPEMTEVTSARIKGSKFIEMKDIGHFPMSENYDTFKKYLVQGLQFISDRTGTVGKGAQAKGKRGKSEEARPPVS
jgi:pimeloyl-ACP methyl ester carboxylesterase